MAKAKNNSLAEVLGGDAANLGGNMKLAHLPHILGEAMPDLPKNGVGRHRLMRALQQRFGANFRSLPGIKNLMKEFDDDIAFDVRVAKMRALKPRSK